MTNRLLSYSILSFARLSPGRRSIYKAASSVGIRDVDDIRLSWIPQPGFLPSEVESEAIVNFYQVQLQSDKVYNVFTTFEFPASLKPRERYEFPNIRRFWKN